MRFRRLIVPLLATLAFAAVAAEAGAQPCLIFVHGKQTEHQYLHQLCAPPGTTG